MMVEKYQQLKFNEIFFISFVVKQHQHQLVLNLVDYQSHVIGGTPW